MVMPPPLRMVPRAAIAELLVLIVYKYQDFIKICLRKFWSSQEVLCDYKTDIHDPWYGKPHYNIVAYAVLLMLCINVTLSDKNAFVIGLQIYIYSIVNL